MRLAMERGPYARAGAARGCWFYLRYFFLFASLIQLLVIMGLVLFMVYGNVHLSTESNLRATERRTDELYGQVQQLSAAQSNLTKQLNLTATAKDAIMQLLLGARRDLERINASFRQCQADRLLEQLKMQVDVRVTALDTCLKAKVTYFTYQQYIAAIILSEKQCQDNLKESNRSCEALILKLGEKSKTLELELVKEKAMCAQDKDGLGTAKRMAEGQLAECIKVQELLRQEQQLGQQQLQKVQALCLQLDKDKFEADLRSLWRDSIIPRSLDSLGFGYHPLGSELSSIRRSCDLIPSLMASKVEELFRSLRSGVERVARENTDLQRQKLEVERGLRASEEAKAKAEKEAQAREAKLQAECARQTQLALEEKAALRRERDSLAKELEGKKREVEQLKMQVDVRVTALDTCLKAKSQPVTLPRPVVTAANPPPINPADLEEFKKRILDSQRSPAVNPLVPSSG